jgi:hypothetical protein
MIKGGSGGANTCRGLQFEAETDLLVALSRRERVTVKGDDIYIDGKQVARAFKKHKLYKFLEEHRIDYKKIVSKKLLPDDAIFVYAKNLFSIIEIKFQGVAGSTDEKLQTCDFKIKQYRKLLAPLGVDVQYIYVLNDWFKDPGYSDVLSYIKSIDGCDYFFNELPLPVIGLDCD